MTVGPHDDAPPRLVLPAASVRWWARPASQTVALTVVLGLVGVALAAQAPAQPLLDSASRNGLAELTVAVILALIFFVTELGQARVEVGRQAYSFSLAGVPLVLGLLYCPPRALIAARVVAAVVAFIIQRAPPLKFGFNTATYLLDVSAVILVAHQLIGTSGALAVRTAALSYVALAVVDVLISSLVLAVIRINLGPVSRDDVAEVFVSASAFVAINTAAAFVCAILLGAGPLGVVLLAIFVAVTAVSYRAYLVLRSRHRSLVEIQEFIGTGEGAPTVRALAERMLPPVRELLRSARVELTLRDETGQEATVVSIDETGAMRVDPRGHGELDEFLSACIEGEGALLLTGRSHAAAAQRWLDNQDVQDALIVPLLRLRTPGILVVLDRLGDTTHFTPDDLTLLQTLAGHLGVALQSVQLFEQLLYDATHDALTDLPNRSVLTATMKSMLSRPEEEGRAAVLLLDLDRFKDVNDALGHDIGDQVLRVVAGRLRELVPAGATVGRLGGDEFAVVLPPSANAVQAAMDVAGSISGALRTPVQLHDVTVSTEGSIGVAVAARGQSHTDLMRHADTAMYAAKDSGVPEVVYSGDLDHGSADRLSLLTDLRAALDRDEIEVHYQPKADLASNLISSVEALIRWTHPTLGPIEPADFIPLAESTGLIDQLTQTVLATSLRDCRRWRDAGHDIAVAVNLSARNLDDSNLPDLVASALVMAGVPADRLSLEITESSIMGDPARTLPTLERLAALGIALSVDDFGTGHSSLSYLQRLPVRELKIDRGFVIALTPGAKSRQSEALVRGIIELGHSLDLRVVAEGVDTAALLEQLRGLGCDIAQGFYLAHAMPATELLEAVRCAELSLRSNPGNHGTRLPAQKR